MIIKHQKFILVTTGALLLVIGVVAMALVSHEDYFKPLFSSEGCQLAINRDDAPMIIAYDKNEFVYPEPGESSFTFSKHESLRLVCPGSRINLGSELTYTNITSATCVSGNFLNINNKTSVQWTQISCASEAKKTAKLTGRTCENNGKEVNIGFDVNNIFLTVMRICFDPKKQQALYSEANITAAVSQGSSAARPSWTQGPSSIFNIKKVDQYYKIAKQRPTINKLLGLEPTSTKYIQSHSSYYLARGHLTAKADNFYDAQQDATFFLINAAPQWQTNNDGNWKSVEASVRDYAEANQVNIQEITGVYGVATLPHNSTQQEIELYLYNDGKQSFLPVPEFYWKLVYEPISQKGLVIIVQNNPYKTNWQPICEDIADKISWINWKRNEQKGGFGYVCTVDSFKKIVSYVPKLTVRGILT
ncbi:unnamed protein product [Ceutorhynchus assimilis]|uniref:DNA/RNA non-specific endonuclease/pyrophosphatase/phosphodiesterase domain-containing protein n=1 Tax=Ceutorhynchus assimilis TaxID=467358 RepID=A0A9N9MIS6_9CUCU|nr:unnamed protein product [Ceutorhynchus assimilis]